jgi:hypothetical protein
MVVKIRKIHLIILTLIFSCQSKSIEPEEIIILEDQISKILEGQKLQCIDSLNSYVDIRFFQKYLLLTDRNRENHFDLYEISNSCKELLKFAKRGDGPDEFGMPFPINSSMENIKQGEGFSFKLFDVNLKKISEVQFINSTKPKTEVLTNQKMDPLLVGGFEINVLNSGNLIGKNHMEGKGNLFFFNPENREIKWVDFYPETENEPLPDKKALAYESFIDISENHGVIVQAMRFFNRINFYSFSGKLQKSITLGKPIEPDFSQDTKFFVPENVNFFFKGIVCGREYIFGLIDLPTENETPNFIILDYDGKFINGYQLDKEIIKFAIDEDNSIFYGTYYNPEKDGAEIYSYKF